MIQLQHLIFFEKIAEKSSMNKAAEELYISQPNLSKAIQNLEKELQIKIFERTNKGVKLTEDGYKLYKYTKTIRKQVDMIQGIALKEIPNTISVSAYPCPILYKVLGEFYNINKEKYIEVTLKEERIQNIIESVANLQSDIGIIEINDVQKKEVRHILESKNLEYHEFANDTWYALVGKSSPFYNKEIIEMSQLIDCTIMRSPDDYFSNLSYLFEVDGVHFTQFEKTMFVNDYLTRLRLLNMTNMVCIETSWDKEPEREFGVRAIPIANCNIQISMGWIKRKKENLSEKVLDFIEILEKLFQ
jgi:DNA-binding transcriptional LysR family regulator